MYRVCLKLTSCHCHFLLSAVWSTRILETRTMMHWVSPGLDFFVSVGAPSSSILVTSASYSWIQNTPSGSPHTCWGEDREDTKINTRNLQATLFSKANSSRYSLIISSFILFFQSLFDFLPFKSLQLNSATCLEPLRKQNL